MKLRSIVAAACIAASAPALGCAAVAQWWQQFEQNPAATIGALVQYVDGFISTAQSIWAVIAPLLGASSASATADFNSSIVTLQDALTALQDGVQAAALAQNPNPDFSALTAAVQDAVAKVVAIVAQWQSASVRATASESMGLLNHQATQIAAWKVKP